MSIFVFGLCVFIVSAQNAASSKNLLSSSSNVNYSNSVIMPTTEHARIKEEWIIKKDTSTYVFSSDGTYFYLAKEKGYQRLYSKGCFETMLGFKPFAVTMHPIYDEALKSTYVLMQYKDGIDNNMAEERYYLE